MTTSRDLPNVYTTLNDMSALIEGNDSLTVGVTVKADRGPVGQALRVTDSSDFLTRYTFTGKPGAKQDSAYFDIIELLKVSNNVYVSRAANNPLYGGLVVKKEIGVGDFKGVAEYNEKRIIVDGDITNKLTAGGFVRIQAGKKSYRYAVKEFKFVGGKTDILFTEKVEAELIDALATAKEEAGALAYAKEYAAWNSEIEEAYQEAYAAAIEEGKEAEEAKTAAEAAKTAKDTEAKAAADVKKAEAIAKIAFPIFNCVAPVKLNTIFITDKVKTADLTANEEKGYKGAFVIDDEEGSGALSTQFQIGDRIRLENCKKADKVTGAEEDTQYYTVVLVEYNSITTETKIYVKEKIDGVYAEYSDAYAGVKIYREALANPEAFVFAEDDLFLITGIDQGAYNANIGIAIDSGNEVELDETAGAFKLYVHNLLTGADLEEFLVALNPLCKSIDGTNLEIAGIINDTTGAGSEYIKVFVNPALDFDDDTVIIPASTPQRELNLWCALGGGYDGDNVEVADCINALEVFADKTVPVSLLVNGNNENILYQLAMLGICEARKDCFAFLRTFRSYEKLALPAQRVKQLVNYKKNTLGSTDYLAAMYGPHVTTYDNFNSRNVVIGADSVACRKWLQVIQDYGYPRAAAGIDDGRLNNISLEWKIGDESSEAKNFNDASMNMIVWDAKRKFYYFNTQNTLQLANSAFRNVGAVLNVLDIKEYLTFNLKYYIQKPIDGEGTLQEACIRTIEQFMDTCKSGGRVSDYVVQDVTTKKHISDNELHFVLTLAPAYYAQKIYLAINVVNAAFDFQILQSM